MDDGDDLSPLSNIVIPGPAQPDNSNPFRPDQTANGNANDPAAAAVRVPVNIPETHTVPQDIELPSLPLDPTEDDLINYAKAHPTTILAMKIFRATIVGVERR